MSLTVNWACVAGGVILLCLVIIAAVAWGLIDSRRTAREERRERLGFERDMAAASLPEWDGGTYDWPAGLRAYLGDPHAYSPPREPVPDSTVSGPLPQLDTALDDEAFLDAMRARTDLLIDRMAGREPR